MTINSIINKIEDDIKHKRLKGVSLSIYYASILQSFMKIEHTLGPNGRYIVDTILEKLINSITDLSMNIQTEYK